MARMGLFLLLAMVGMSISAQLIAGQAPAPGPDCTNELVELLPCLEFLTNSSVTTVVPACCSGLANASASPYCLCSIISGNQTSQLGLNDTRVIQLPSFCNLSLNPNRCVAILGPTAAPVPAFGPSPLATSPAPISLGPAPSAATPSVTPISAPESSGSPAPAGDCSAEISSLVAPCLGFVTGAVASPSSACCTDLGDVVSTSPQCLCTLATSAGPVGVNSTLVGELPGLCKVSLGSFSISDCSNVPAPSSPGSGAPGSSPSGNYGAKSARPTILQAVIAMCLGYFANFLLN